MMIDNQRLPSLFHTLIPKPRNQDHRSATERVITQKSTRQNRNLKKKNLNAYDIQMPYFNNDFKIDLQKIFSFRINDKITTPISNTRRKKITQMSRKLLRVTLQRIGWYPANASICGLNLMS